MVLEEGYWSQSIIKKDSLGYEYCYIPDSTFLYGKNRMPSRIHAPFYMAKFPVTVEQYKRFVKETSYDYDLFDIMEQLSPKSDCPATPLSWQNAKAYARWLRSATGEYYSLPSEEEWEIAARGTDGRLYPWGNTLPLSDGKNVDLTPKRLRTSPVGSQPLSVSPFGCMDIVGNVWEWVEDKYHLNYVGAPTDGSVWLQEGEGSNRVLRGGSWFHSQPLAFLGTYRIRHNPRFRDSNCGIRVAARPL